MTDKQKASKGNSKAGRNKAKCAAYRALHTREINKVSRVLQSNGVEFASTWARNAHVEDVLRKLIAKRGNTHTAHVA